MVLVLKGAQKQVEQGRSWLPSSVVIY